MQFKLKDTVDTGTNRHKLATAKVMLKIRRGFLISEVLKQPSNEKSGSWNYFIIELHTFMKRMQVPALDDTKGPLSSMFLQCEDSSKHLPYNYDQVRHLSKSLGHILNTVKVPSTLLI